MNVKNYPKLLKASFSPNKNWLIIFIAEALFIFFTYKIFQAFVEYLETLATQVGALNLARFRVTLEVSLAQANIEMMETMLTKFYTAITVSIIVIVILYIILNSFIWARIAKLTYDKKYMQRYVFTSIPVIALIIVVFLGVLKLYRPDMAGTYFIIYSLVALHIITAMHIAVIKSKAKHALKETLKFAFEKFHYFIVPYVVGVVVIVIIFNIVGFFMDSFQPDNLFFISLSIIAITWWRMHIYQTFTYYTK